MHFSRFIRIYTNKQTNRQTNKQTNKQTNEQTDKQTKPHKTMNFNNQAICITAGEQSENHAGMEINGNGLCQNGFTIYELEEIQKTLGKKNIQSEYIRLDSFLEESDKEGAEPAGLLFIRNGVEELTGENPDDFLKELLSFEWDKKYWDQRRQKVLNKLARYNVCFGEDEQNPDYENKKGTIVGYENVPILQKWKNSLSMTSLEKKQTIWKWKGISTITQKNVELDSMVILNEKKSSLVLWEKRDQFIGNGMSGQNQSGQELNLF